MISAVNFLANATQNEFTLTSLAFQNLGPIPDQYTCKGENISPALSWTGVPEVTKSFVLIVDDPDAPAKTWTHWLLFNIPATTQGLPENSPNSQFGAGLNDFQKTGYGGPCPSAGKVHHYNFTLYALDTKLNLPNGSSKEKILKVIQNHILKQTTLTGTYQN